MAVIKPVGARPFRHFGSPDRKPGATDAVIKYVSTVGVRLGYTVVIGWIVTLAVALVVSPLIWLGWNRGLVPALGCHLIPWPVAYFVTLFGAAVANLFRATFSYKRDD
jgi:hypothetical protein